VGLIDVGAPGSPTRLGQVYFCGERVDEPPRVPWPDRVMEHWVLSYVTDGSGTYRSADGRILPVLPGSVIVVPPRVRHWYGTEGGAPWTETFVVFGGPLFDLVIPRSDGGTGDDGPRRPTPPPSRHALRAIVHAPQPRAGDAERRLLALADWLVDVVGPTGGGPSPPVAETARRLAAEPATALDLRQVAADAGLSYTTFRRRFTAEIGESPGAYRARARLVAVAGMLRLTDMTTRELARRFGFTDEFHLSRRFKAQFGMPPSEYRRRR